MASIPLHSSRAIAALLAAATIAAAPLPAESFQTPVPKTTKSSKTGKSGKSSNTSKTNKKSSSGRSKSSASKSKSTAPKGPTSSAEAKRRQEETQKEINRTKEQIRLNEQQVKEGLADLNRLQSEIETGKTKVSELEGKVGALQNEMTGLAAKIETNEKELATLRDEYLKAVKKMRLTKKNQSTLAFVFSSENFNQALRRVRYLKQFSEWKEKKSSDIDSKIETLRKENERLAQVREQQTAVLTQLQSSQRNLEAKHRRQGELVAGLRQNGDILQSHLSAKQAEANQLKQSISALIAQEQAKAEAERKEKERAAAEKAAREKAMREKAAAEKAAAEKAAADAASAKEADSRKAEDTKKAAEKKTQAEKKEAEKKAAKKASEEKKVKNSEKGSRKKNRKDKNVKETTPAPTVVNPEKTTAEPAKTAETKSASNFGAAKGSLPRPVDGSWRITNQFGRHSMPELPDVVYDNPGIDAEVEKGSAAKAVYAGKVSGIYKVAGYGTVVIVNHGEYYTVYGNLASASVGVGSQVKAGQKLGTVAPDPDDSRRSSIHFEVWKGREKLNPTAWIR